MTIAQSEPTEGVALLAHPQPTQSAHAYMPADAGAIAVSKSRASIALLRMNGRIAALSDRLARDLTLSSPWDLSGLHVTSLCAHADRKAMAAALAVAKSGRTAKVAVNMTYAFGQDRIAMVSMTPAVAGTGILLTFDPTGRL